MNLQTLPQDLLQRVKQRPIVFAIIGLAVIAFVVMLFRTSGKPTQSYSYYEVKRGDFLISIVEGGALEAVNEVSIRCDVEGTARIIYIVNEGTYVKKGDLLVELDSSATQDAINQQQINVEKAQFAVVQAEQQMEIQKSVVDSDIQQATLRVEFAESDLKKYVEGEARQAERNAQIDITNVLENLQIADERFQWSDKLYKEGFETKGNLDKDRLTVNQSKLRLEQALTNLWMVETFDIPKRKRSLESAVEEAKENLDRVKLQSERRLAQAVAELQTQKRTLELSQTKLDRDKKTLEATKIHAPQDGLVVYGSPGGGGGGGGGGGRGFSSESMIEEGAVVRNRQELIKLPDVSAMKLTVRIHESHINQVHVGQPAFIVMDSMPDQRFNGVVNKVAPLPDSGTRFANPDLKVYTTEILVTDKLDVKPGVSARAEIIITNLPGVLTVPIQAVTTRKGKQVIFLASAPQEPVPVKIGMYNIKFIEVTSGLKEGDQVMLAPPFDTKEKDLGGAIIADGEAVPASATNQSGRVPGRNQGRNGRGESGSMGIGAAGSPDPRALTTGDGAVADDNASQLASGGGRRRFNPDDASAGDGSQPDTAGGGRRGGRGGRGNSQEMFKQFDVNTDGKLDENEFSAMLAGMRGGRGGGGLAASLTNRQEVLKQFDANGDGQVDETELAAGMRTLFTRQGNRGNPPAEPAVN